MTKLYKCTLRTTLGLKKQQFFMRGQDALEVFYRVKECEKCSCQWTIEAMEEEQLLEEGLDFLAHYGMTA